MQRRQFLQLPLASPALASAAAQTAAAQTGAAQTSRARRPNIILIMADDMGFSDLGCYGSEIATPHLDSLAKGGLRFTHFTNNARCCPTRASLLTGLYSHQAGIGHMVQELGLPAYEGKLNDRCVTLAEVLGDSGYQTLMAGKWHVGEERPHWPLDRGFQKYFGLINGASSYWELDKGRTLALGSEAYTPPPPAPGKDPFYLTDAFTDHALQFVREAKTKADPYFLYLAYTSPHWPLHAPESDVKKYEGKYLGGWDALRQRRHKRMIELGIVDPRWPLSPRDPSAPAWDTLSEAEKKAQDRAMAVYAAQIDRMDQNIGRLLAELRQGNSPTHNLDNTLILFLADNGGCAEVVKRSTNDAPAGQPGSYLSYGLPWANASNTPFRLYKHWAHEGGIATPLIAHWPARIRRPNRISSQTGHLIDIMPTLCQAAAASYPTRRRNKQILPMEGQSLLPALDDRPAVDRTLFWEHEGNRAMRDGRWKLVSQYNSAAGRPGEWQLFDLQADRTESKDLSATETARLAKMTQAYTDWERRCGVESLEKLNEIRGRLLKK